MSAFSLDWSEFDATISVDSESSQVCLLRPKTSRKFLVSSVVVSNIMLGDFRTYPVSSLSVVTLGASAVKSAGLVRKCAIPWLGDERSVSVDWTVLGAGLVLGLFLGLFDSVCEV